MSCAAAPGERVEAVGAKPESDTDATYRALSEVTAHWTTTKFISLEYDPATGEVASTYQKLTAHLA